MVSGRVEKGWGYFWWEGANCAVDDFFCFGGCVVLTGFCVYVVGVVVYHVLSTEHKSRPWQKFWYGRAPIIRPPINQQQRFVCLMNHHDHNHSDHVNGQQVNGDAMTEEELDAYEDRLTSEAVHDQVKVLLPPWNANARHFSQHKNSEYPSTMNLKRNALWTLHLIHQCLSRPCRRRKIGFWVCRDNILHNIFLQRNFSTNNSMRRNFERWSKSSWFVRYDTTNTGIWEREIWGCMNLVWEDLTIDRESTDVGTTGRRKRFLKWYSRGEKTVISVSNVADCVGDGMRLIISMRLWRNLEQSCTDLAPWIPALQNLLCSNLY